MRICEALAKNVLRRFHVIEGRWFTFSHNASQSPFISVDDGDYLTKANPAHTCCKVKKVLLLLAVGAAVELKSQTCLKLGQEFF